MKTESSAGSESGWKKPDEVRNFYERRPYPAPLKDLNRHQELYRDPLRRRALFHLMWPARSFPQEQTILVAGCGTSQAATIAMREPDAHVVAIDISTTSLENTQALKQKHSLRNLDIHQLSVEQVSLLQRNFDQVICTGVLHHLPDPLNGLKALRCALKPEGAMDVMVYGQYGRTGIYMLQDYCRMLGVNASDRGLEDLRQMLDALPPDHPIAAVMQRSKDFRHPDALADALLHPQDRAYTVPQLFEWLNRAGMAHGRWFEQAPYLPQCGAIGTTPHAAHLGRLPLASQYAAMELFRGTMTKHRFIAYLQDHRDLPQPVQLLEEGSGRRGNRWQGVIPIRLPWTTYLRDRPPVGAVAVLVNRAHSYADLTLPADAEQLRLWEAIDGVRTLEEIITSAAGAVHPRRALRWFRRLWQYDQIVFDTSQA